MEEQCLSKVIEIAGYCIQISMANIESSNSCAESEAAISLAECKRGADHARQRYWANQIALQYTTVHTGIVPLIKPSAILWAEYSCMKRYLEGFQFKTKRAIQAGNHERLKVEHKTDCYLLISSLLLITISSNPLFPSNCVLSSMDQQHSTLELVRHDESARAPECGYDATAFELDSSALAPQISKRWYVTTNYTD